MGPSGATSLLEGIANILKPGIVITPDPMYYIYCNYLERMGYELLAVPEDAKGLRIDLLEQKLAGLGDRRADISFFYIVTVNNPTASVLANERRQALVALAAGLSENLGRKIPVIFDKAYEDLLHDPALAPLRSGLLDDRLGLVYEVATLSKIISPALRIGYMLGPDGPFLKAMVQKTSDVGFSAPLITQEIASYLLDHHVTDQIEKVNRGYREKALSIRRWIEESLEDYLQEVRGGRAAFYYYLTFREIQTTEGSAFFRFLSRTTGRAEIDGPPQNHNPRVIYVPGEFCVHPAGDLVEQGKRQLRLSYGFEELERIQAALGYMREAAEFALRQE
ncbi:pyridoxal phosphate-dependent aminotransferase [Thermodesulfobacteriota bacterium]